MRRAARRSSKTRKALWIILTTLLIAVMGMGSWAGYLYYKGNELVGKISTVGPDESGKEVTTTAVEPAKPITLLLMGIDFRKETGSLNSDVIMVASLNPETKSATIVSLPRDFQMKPKDRNLQSRKANYYYPHFYLQDKLTAFSNTKKLFSEFLQVPIDAAVTIDFDGFRKVIDELGGVDVNVSMDMRYVDEEDGTNINLKKGQQKLNGKQALDYVRYRKSNMGTDGTTDYDRNMRQQEVIHQVMEKVMSLGGVMKLGQLMDVAGDSIRTDIPGKQLMGFFQKYIGIDRSQIDFIGLEGEWESPFIILTQEEIDLARLSLKTELQIP
ncbi:LCP family protein [Paenibacillus sp. N1-5-1-14]|uniref:LCP family protein n=1 Tax=Paenibacillus radicibacter TaxID=2972488 RepID=UPI00215900E8|nr:LCP family protein [Paenibacillus radicibacter]MCR8641616.1 LCP family protein [Paenibacillus radicibacter]